MVASSLPAGIEEFRGSTRGSASVAVVAGTAFVMLMMLGLIDLSTFFVARARAQTAADAAALAAAGELLPPNGAPTKPGNVGRTGRSAEEEAARFARANHARLVLCLCQGGESVAVAVAVPVRFVVLGPVGPREVKARARAEIDLRNLQTAREGR